MKTKQLQRESNVLRSKNDTMKDENKQLTALLEKMSVNNENQIQRFDAMNCEIDTLKDKIRQTTAENQQLKVSQYIISIVITLNSVTIS